MPWRGVPDRLEPGRKIHAGYIGGAHARPCRPWGQVGESLRCHEDARRLAAPRPPARHGAGLLVSPPASDNALAETADAARVLADRAATAAQACLDSPWGASSTDHPVLTSDPRRMRVRAR